MLPSLVDLLLRHERLLHLLLNLARRTLGGLQVLHEGCISEKVAPGIGKAGEEGVFQLLQLDLKLVLLPGQLSLDSRRRE